jgi:hydrogenase expression/formation protein HypE
MATVCTEIVHSTQQGVYLYETAIPVKQQVTAVCEMLGYDPYYLACEGRVMAIVAAEQSEQALQRWQQLPGGEDAAIIGDITADNRVILETALGGQRLLDELEDDPLPRIC